MLICELNLINVEVSCCYVFSKSCHFVENIGLRNLERLNLYHALLENDIQKKYQYLSAFIKNREERASQINEYLSYENLIETVEGPAWYVEFMAFFEKGTLEYDAVLLKYGQSLINQYESTSHIRMSCYSSGLFMCLLLDGISPGWKMNFLKRDEPLYDFFKVTLDNIDVEPINHIEVSLETEKVINFAIENRKNEFKKFQEQMGIHLIIEGEMKAEAFDPMNIVFLEDTLLHKNFLKVKISDDKFLIQQPVVGTFNDRIQNITRLQLVLKENPIENNDSLIVEGVGELKGRYIKDGNTYRLFAGKGGDCH